MKSSLKYRWKKNFTSPLTILSEISYNILRWGYNRAPTQNNRQKKRRTRHEQKRKVGVDEVARPLAVG